MKRFLWLLLAGCTAAPATSPSGGISARFRPAAGGACLAVAFSPDGRTIAAGWTDGSRRLWSASTGHPFAESVHERHPVQSIWYDGSVVRSLCKEGCLRRWTPERDEDDLLANDVTAAAFCGALWAVATREGLVLHGGASDWIVEETPEAPIRRLAFSSDGRLLAAAGAFRPVQLVDTSTRAPVAELDRLFWPSSLQFTPDGRFLVSQSTGHVRAWDAGFWLGAVELDVDCIDRSAVAVTHGGRVIAVAADPRLVLLVDLDAAREIGAFAAESAVVALGASPDGRRLVTGLTDGTAVVWRLPPAPPPPTFPGDPAAAWDDLCRSGAAAWRATQALATDPPAFLALARERLPRLFPAVPPDHQRLVNALAADAIDERDEAWRRLEALGDEAEAALVSVLAAGSLDAKERASALLATIQSRPASRQAACLRVIRLLSRCGSPARPLIETIRRHGWSERERSMADEALNRLH